MEKKTYDNLEAAIHAADRFANDLAYELEEAAAQIGCLQEQRCVLQAQVVALETRVKELEASLVVLKVELNMARHGAAERGVRG